MKKIIRPRTGGKTTELIRVSEETGNYIVTATRSRAECVAKMAREQGRKIPFPVTLAEYMRSGFRGSFIKHILIDDADGLLQTLFRGVEIDAITMTDPDPLEISECEYCGTPEKTIGIVETDDRIFVGLAGAYIQVFDEEYPGFVENMPIRFCPMCGRRLSGAAETINAYKAKGESNNE